MMDTFFRWYRRVLRYIGATVCLFLLLFTLFLFFFGTGGGILGDTVGEFFGETVEKLLGGEGGESLLVRLVTGETSGGVQPICRPLPAPPAASVPPPELSELAD